MVLDHVTHSAPCFSRSLILISHTFTFIVYYYIITFLRDLSTLGHKNHLILVVQVGFLEMLKSVSCAAGLLKFTYPCCASISAPLKWR